LCQVRGAGAADRVVVVRAEEVPDLVRGDAGRSVR